MISRSASSLSSSIRLFSNVAALSAILIGLSVLIGWIVAAMFLAKILPGMVEMKPNTALAFTVAGLSLCWSQTTRSGRQRRLAQAAAVVVTLIGLLTLVEYIGDIDLAIDQLLFKYLLTPATLHSGRMAPATALNFLLLGEALVLVEFETRRGHRPAEWLALAAILVSMVALVGYLYKVQESYHIASDATFGLHIALLFLVLAVGVLCARPDAGLMALISSDTVGGLMVRRLLPAGAGVLIGLGWLGLAGRRTGVYDVEFGLSLMVLAAMVALSGLIWLSARSLNRAEQTLQQQAFLLDQTYDAVIVWQWKGPITFWNRGAERIYGFSGGEALGKLSHELLHTRAPGSMEALLRALERDRRWEGELEQSRRDGRRLAVETRMVIARDAGRAYVLEANRDITERKQAEEGNRRLAAIVESSEDAIISKDLNGIITSWNQGAERSFGYTAEEMIGHPMTVLLPPDRADEEARILESIRRGERIEAFKTVRKRKDGTLFDISLSVSPVRDADGRIIGASKIARDITEDKLAEAVLLENEARKSAILDSALDAIITMDHQGKVVEFNPMAEKLFGYKRREVIARPLADLIIPPALREMHRQGLARYLASGESRLLGKRIEMTALRADGSELAVELSVTRISTDGPPMFTAYIRDLTEQKAQEEMRRRSAALQEENLRVQEANRLKSEFLANMSHELRTPLNAVIGFSQLLYDEKAGPLNTRQRDFLTDVLTGGQYLLQLINDLLDLSKIEAGKAEIYLETFSIKQAVDEVCMIMRPIASKRNITITIEASLTDDRVTLDQQKLKQVLYNLLSNAVKFSHNDGEVKVVVNPEREGSVSVAVKDSGIGIKSEDLPRLFQAFQQLDSGAARRYQGTGLGLALTKKMIEMQQGSIAVESEPGKGSTFTVRMPRKFNGKAAELRRLSLTS